MHIGSKNTWRIYPRFIGAFLLLLAPGLLLIPITVLGLSHRPLLYLEVFFFALVVLHFFLTFVNTGLGHFGTIVAYAALVDLTILILVGRPTIYLLLPPLVAGLLVASSVLLAYLVNHHLIRNVLGKFRRADFQRELETFQVELRYRHLYNIIILVAFYTASFMGYFLQWTTSLLFLRFTEFAILGIAGGSLHRIVKDGMRMSRALSEDVSPSVISICWSAGSARDYFRRMVEIACGFERPKVDDREAIVDYFDRAAEIRKLFYYSSLLLVLVMALYGSAYVMIPCRLIMIGFRHVAAVCVFTAIALVQVPYYIGQKRLALELTRSFSGTEWREMRALLGKQSPAWDLLHTGELLGAGVMPPLVMWLLTVGGNALKHVLNW